MGNNTESGPRPEGAADPIHRRHGSVVTPGQGAFWEQPPTDGRLSELRGPAVEPEVEAILVNEVEDDVDVVVVGESRIERDAIVEPVVADRLVEVPVVEDGLDADVGVSAAEPPVVVAVVADADS